MHFHHFRKRKWSNIFTKSVQVYTQTGNMFSLCIESLLHISIKSIKMECKYKGRNLNFFNFNCDILVINQEIKIMCRA